ncbi:uncharacterized protein PGTG_01675 [Puccinia graminis f. sp. tritici CRL 75-36-700-3]|uniref:Uncharacterized protein n=1 Tax=Puccinia graminis f. sp. tritici (strain CRL 75-36-700-3 / race SCCL) TaxID=418459 RepID=E3JSQ7_PUCGT|nr:uncharacterized protein PGTG_01675 [Puccinia graminis f. sp. tritici CRL 75-36-700-3]EFP75082.2 hypothetical protein PGTG_01675 [Puccinia graminis f. sp. tritici CRL 75-36-700-3]
MLLPQTQSFDFSCPSSLGLDSDFVALTSSYANTNFETDRSQYNRPEYSEDDLNCIENNSYLPGQLVANTQLPSNGQLQLATNVPLVTNGHLVANSQLFSTSQTDGQLVITGQHIANNQHVANGQHFTDCQHIAAGQHINTSQQILASQHVTNIQHVPNSQALNNDPLLSTTATNPNPVTSSKPKRQRKKPVKKGLVLPNPPAPLPSPPAPLPNPPAPPILPETKAPNDTTLEEPALHLKKPKPPPRSQRSPQLVEKAKTKGLDELIKLVAEDSTYVRLSAEDTVELNAAYIEYQQSIPPNDRARELARLWNLLDPDTQEKWKDPVFLESITCEAQKAGEETETLANATKRKRKGPAPFDSDKWANKLVADLRQLSRSSGLEGFLVLGSRGKDKDDMFVGGSHLGEMFLDMYATKDDPCQLFSDLIKGQKAVKTISGTEPTLVIPNKKKKPREIITKHDKGSIKENTEFIREKLNKAIDTAVPGGYGRGWPGTNTQITLTKLGLSLRVRDNNLGVTPFHFCKRPGDMKDKPGQLVVAALEEDLFELVPVSVSGSSTSSGAISRTNVNKKRKHNGSGTHGDDLEEDFVLGSDPTINVNEAADKEKRDNGSNREEEVILGVEAE